jgi:transcriptional regulator with XRE-family HTH domain
MPDTLGARLRQARLERGWSRRELASRLGYRSTSTIERYERDEVGRPQERVVIRLARALNVSALWLLDGPGSGNGRP